LEEFLKKLILMMLFITPIVFASDIDVGFSPRRGSLELVLKVINSSRTSLCMATYSFTSKPIAMAIMLAKERGVKIKIVSDAKANKNKYSAVKYLANNGIDVRLNDNYAIMHNKFIVIDNQTVETGSFNYSAGAVNKNAENVLVIWHDKVIANKYQNECDRLYNESIALKPSY
jgi:phosphatidylserine/phosphatidylglycerophosphate/cardiolipin synthase-like enzyme